MDNKEKFNILLEQLITNLVNDKKLIYDNIKKKYKLKTYMSYIISHYNCDEIVKMCQTLDELKFCIINKDNPFNHYCISCGKQIEFNGVYYPETCRTNKCLCDLLLKNDAIKDKHQFIIDNYLNGDKQFTYNQIGCIEKYSVYSNSQMDSWYSSLKTTWDNKSEKQLKEKRDKTITTCRQRYGCDFSQQNEQVKEKQRITWANKSKEELDVKNEKRKNTTLKKYGCDHVMKSDFILNNVRQRNFEKFGYYSWQQKHIQHKDIYFNDELFIKYVKDLYKENNNTRVKKVLLDKYFNINTLSKCKTLKLLKYVQIFESKLENKFKEFFNEHNIKYNWRNRSIIEGPNGKSHCYEIDFYLPDYNVGIEINDISSHNVISLKKHLYGSNYHVYKTNQCKNKGIRLIHIWEWEIQNNFEKLTKWLLNELNKEKTHIYARKCEIKIVSTNEEKTFLNEYHLQGYSKSEISLGLYYNNELLQIMTFVKPRFNKKYSYELLRLCTKFNYIIIGGSNKLFSYFVKNYEFNNIISYCDYSKFYGNIYNTIGMHYVKLSKPLITYCNYDMKIFNESIVMKYGVDNILGTNYGKNANNKELMIKEGYLPICNCGNLIFEYTK